MALCAGCNPDPPEDTASPGACDPAPGVICTVVGEGGRGFNGDGHDALQTLLYFPTAVRFDHEDRMVFVDFNNQRIRRVDHDHTVTTLAGNGMHAYALPGAHALDSPLENPIDLALLDDGRMLIAELHAGRILEIDANQIVRAYAGTGILGYEGDDGPAALASLSEAVGITLADDQTLYIADTDNHCIRSVSAEPEEIPDYPTPTRVIRGVSGNGYAGHADGALDAALFARPQHLLWHDGALYVADASNHRVRRLDLQTGQVETLAGDGTPGHAGDGGPGTEASLREPSGLALAEDGTLYIADRGNHVIRALRPDGVIETVAGQVVPDQDGLPQIGFEGDGGPATDARLAMPQTVTLGPDGHLYIADTVNSVIRVLYL